MDIENLVVKLCIAGTRAEFEGKPGVARDLYRQAWDAHCTDYEACIAAHYVARFQETPEDRFFWNQEALKYARLVTDESVKDFYPSLYLNLGHSFEDLRNMADAEYYYDLAACLGVVHQPE